MFKVKANGDMEATEFIESYAPSLVDYSTWVAGDTGSCTGWSQNGSTFKNTRIIFPNPLSEDDIVWATEEGDASSTADGGWVGGVIPIDNTQWYRYTVWIKRTDAGDGRTYLGIYGYKDGANVGITNTSGEAVYNTTNPYPFTYLYASPFNREDWLLHVIYIAPYGTTSQPSFVTNNKGSYLQDGTRIYSGGTMYCFRSDNNQMRIRSYLYYSTSLTENQYWYRPRLDKVDGSEPSIAQLLALSENENLHNIKTKLGATTEGHLVETDSIATGVTHRVDSLGTIKVTGQFKEV